jgi:hypothetical protein
MFLEIDVYILLDYYYIFFLNNGLGLLVEKENDILRLHSELEAVKTSAALMNEEGDQEERLMVAQGIITTLENRHKDQEQKIGK